MKFTIIPITCQSTKNVQKTVDSIADQTFWDFELLMRDDEFNGNTGKIWPQWVTQHPPISSKTI